MDCVPIEKCGISQVIVAFDGFQQGSAAREVRAKGLVEGQRHDTEEAWLRLGDALLTAVHEGADGEVGPALQIALYEKLQVAKRMWRWEDGCGDFLGLQNGQISPVVSGDS